MGLVGNIVNNSGVLKDAAQRLIALDRTRMPVVTPLKLITVPSANVINNRVPAPVVGNGVTNLVSNSLFGKGSLESANPNLNSIQANVSKAYMNTSSFSPHKSNLGNAQKYLDAAAKSTGQVRTNNMALARKELAAMHNEFKAVRPYSIGRRLM